MGTYTFKMPDIGEGVTEAEIVAWHVAVGDTIEEDAPIADAMTDKATIELTAPVDGVVSTLGCEEGDKIAVGSALVVFATEGEVEAEEPEVKTPPEAAKTSPKRSREPARTTEASDKVLASPAIRRIAQDRGIDLSSLTGSGPDGRIVRADLDTTPAARPVSTLQMPEVVEGETRTKVIGMRRLIAERMADSKRNVAHFTYVDEVDVTELEALRQRANAGKSDERPKLTVLPFIIRALCLALEKWPQFNGRYYDEQGQMAVFDQVDLGIATQTDQGLLVPVLKGAQSLTLWKMADEIGRLSTGAREQTLTKAELTGATTTLTSLGPLGGIVTTPVVNRPEVAIFGPNKIRPKLEMRDGAVVERLVMNFSVSCDHRIIDGYDAAQLVQYMKGLLEDPTQLFL